MPHRTTHHCNFVVGQHVVCVSELPWVPVTGQGSGIHPGPERGEVCLITELRDVSGEIFLVFPRWPHHYHHMSFRPVRETNIDLFRRMLAPTPRQRETVR